MCVPSYGDLTTGCKSGTPPDCKDGDKCTKDYCDEKENTCKHKPIISYYFKCGKGLFLCNIPQDEITDLANGKNVYGCNTGTVDIVKPLDEDCEIKLYKYTKGYEKCPNGAGVSNYGIIDYKKKTCKKYGFQELQPP
jgi:hypothetical protein